MAGEAVAVVTLGCGRNEADSDQVGGSLEAAGFTMVDDPAEADCVLVNTCTFIAPAREESIEVILEACDLPERVGPDGVSARPAVLVIGCMAERYGAELAEALPEAAGVVGFGAYPRLPELVARSLDARRTGGALPLLPASPPALAPSGRAGLPLLAPSNGLRRPPGRSREPVGPPTASFPVRTQPRGPWAYLKIAGGCDRGCTFCTIPSYRGRFSSRSLDEIVAEAAWLAEAGVRELVCVSENTTSWGKDLPGGRSGQVELVAALDGVAGLERVRLMYLQPAEILPELLDAMAESRVVAPYYDLSLQHASPTVLARMARSGGAERFLALVDDIRRRDPTAVFRSSFIVGFPGETERDVEVLEQFLAEARLDWTGFFVFSREDGTASFDMPDQIDPDEARRRRDALLDVADAVAEEQAARFVGRQVDVLVESAGEAEGLVGRSYREAPETDGEVRIVAGDQGDYRWRNLSRSARALQVGDLVPCRIMASDGVDLVAEALG